MSTNCLDKLTPISPPNTAHRPTSQAVTLPKCESLWHIKEMFLKHVGVSFGKYFNARCSPSPFREFRTKLSPTSKRKNRYFHQQQKKLENAHKHTKQTKLY